MAGSVGAAVEGEEGGQGRLLQQAVSRRQEALHSLHVPLPIWPAAHGACEGLHYIGHNRPLPPDDWEEGTS